MAATSTNKQPLLVDHVLHTVVDLVGATVAENGGVDIGGTNNAVLIIEAPLRWMRYRKQLFNLSRNRLYH